MVLTIDIGNTNIVIGCIDENQTYFVERISTDTNKTDLEYAICFKNIMELYHISLDQIEGGIISSVVPPITYNLKYSIEKIIKKEVMVVGPGIKTGLNIKIDNPGQLGSDLVVDAVAALAGYQPPIIVIDMGTATTFSVIDKAGNYLGGAIIPGVKISLDTLTSRTSQLPRISLEAPKHVIATNTISCMKSGIIHGSAAMVDGMVQRIEEELGEPATVLSTGGLARFITPYCKREVIYDDTLLLKGLWIIYQKNK